MSDTLPKALKHGAFREVFPNVFMVSGAMGFYPGISCSRNMTVIREGERLVVINSVRLSEQGHRALDELGEVTDVLSIAGFHGRDDEHYKRQYGAKIWDLEGHMYTRGFGKPKPEDVYFTADTKMNAQTELPLQDASLYVFESRSPEAMVLLDRDGGVAVGGDALQNWERSDEYFSFLGTLMMKSLGFIRPRNVGPGWIKQARPSRESVRAVLDLPFEHLLPAHGREVIGHARDDFRPSIEAFAASSR